MMEIQIEYPNGMIHTVKITEEGLSDVTACLLDSIHTQVSWKDNE